MDKQEKFSSDLKEADNWLLTPGQMQGCEALCLLGSLGLAPCSTAANSAVLHPAWAPRHKGSRDYLQLSAIDFQYKSHNRLF